MDFDYHAVENMEKFGIDGWKMLRHNDFSNTFRQYSFTGMEINEIVKINGSCYTILKENEKYIKKIPSFKNKISLWDTPSGKDWLILFNRLYPY